MKVRSSIAVDWPKGANSIDKTKNYKFRLVVSCPDQTGIVAAVSDFISSYNGWITEAHQFTDTDAKQFFMRYEIEAASLPFSIENFKKAFSPIAKPFAMNWFVRNTAQKRKVVIMVSRYAHCLSDLLYRWRSGDLSFDIPCVISNHEDLRSYVEWHDIPYIHIPINKENKQQAFTEIMQQIDEAKADTVVLARYMQILPTKMCQSYFGQIINIHHSFLPSFVGAKPYHQASERGVKLIGATCHYVTEELDAGPIIEQDVIRVSHHNSVEDMVRLGKDVEKAVLAKGVSYHLEDRTMIYGNKTIVFN